MDTKTLAFITVLVVFALALLMVMLAASRKDRSLNIYAVGFVSGVVGVVLLLTQGWLSPWVSIILANLFLIITFFALAWGLRIQCKFFRPWPRRFWLYLAVWLLLKILFTFIIDSYFARSVLTSVFMIALAVEFLWALEHGAQRVPHVTRRSAWIVGIAFQVCHFIRLGLLVAYASQESLLRGTSLVTTFTFSFLVFFLIIWAGLVMIIDVVGLFEKLEHKNAMLSNLATTDELTGLSNRHLLETAVQTEMERAARYLHPLAMVMFDLDHFKLVNDTWGHQLGDMVLKHTARIVGDLIREPDNLFRWGGEEFIILIPHTTLAGAEILAEKVRRAIESNPVPTVGPVTASFGVAEWRPKDSQEDWFKQVDQALYRAKNGGRNRVVCFGEHSRLPLALVKLEWKAEFESGNALVDAEHKQLLEMSNDLLDLSLSSGSGPEILSQLDRLLEHVVQHFADEENILAAVAYPEAAAHAQLHRKLVEDALALRALTIAEGSDPTAFFSFLVGRVVIGHLLQADVLFFPYTRTR